jgi:high-affinity K+ transport system ATPase subunit B
MSPIAIISALMLFPLVAILILIVYAMLGVRFRDEGPRK